MPGERDRELIAHGLAGNEAREDRQHMRRVPLQEVEEERHTPEGAKCPSQDAGRGGRLRRPRRPLEPRINVGCRTPVRQKKRFGQMFGGALRSKIHSGPVKRSYVSVATIGTSHSGNEVMSPVT